MGGPAEAKHLPWSLSIALLGALGVLVVHYWVSWELRRGWEGDGKEERGPGVKVRRST